LREHGQNSLSQRVLGAVDLAIDFATLGEYGLETWPEETGCRRRSGHPAGWEAPATPRQRGCSARTAAARRRPLAEPR
jgi:hypothetical protein